MKIILFLTFFVHIFFFSFCKNFSEINSFPNEGAFSNFASRYDSILPPPDTISYTGPTTFCEGGSIKLTAPTGASYKWQLNGANINGATSATYTVNAVIQSGTYTVIVNSDTSNPITITVNPNPTPAFSFSPDNQCSNIPIQFSNTSIGASSYTWDFGDSNSSDNSSNEINPSHQFIGVPGNGTQTFNIKLTEENDSGCSANISKTITTKQISSTVLAGTGETTYNGSTYFSSCALTDTTLTFVNQSSTINTNYQIQWGDATPNFNATAFLTTTHTYSIGTYAINYIVTNQNGCIDTTIYRVFVGGNPAVGFGNPGSTGICTGSSLTFPISNTASNSSGTIYTVTFNDGSDPIIFKHPPPATVTHTFAVTSCGTNSPPYPNSFSASIQASNPCQSSSATVVPIYVSQKPVAAFSISPNDTVCINSSVVFNNTNPFNDNNINGTCSPGESVWQITPATGWTLKNGSLGNDLNLINPVFWISGSTIIGISFDQIGTFTVKLKTGNSTCGSDSITKTICVNQLPVANFSIDKNIGCAPLIVSTTNNPSPTTCGNNTYNWSVSYSSTTGCSPDTSDYTFTNGTDTNSVNPRFQFKNPGTYTIKLIATSPSGSCFSQPFTQTVTVKGKPNPVLTAPTSICVNQSINPSATASCYTNSATYAWMFGGGTPSSSNIQAPGTINYTTPGTYNISLDVINECGVTNITDSIHVINVTTSNAGPPQKVCGSSVTMAADTTTNGTGLWSRISGPSSYAITTASSPTTTITNLVQGTYVFQWKITNGICSSSSNDTITILSGPTPANAGSDQELCLATIVSLSANPPSIGTGLWSLVRGPADYTITNASSPSTTVTALVPGVYTFQWKTSLNTCTSSMDSVLITIDSSAIKANAGSDQTICSSTVTLSANSPGTQKGTWSLISGPNVPTITNISLSNTSVTGLTAGAYLFQWKISSGVCNASYDTVQINVTATATVADAGQDQSLCAVDSISLTGNKALTGSGKWTVISGPNSPTIADSSLQTSKVTELIHGAYIFRWTITNGNCPATSDSVAITIYDNATISHAGPLQNICGTSTTMAANKAIVGKGKWTVVQAPASPTISDSTSETTIIGNLVPGTYILKWTITNGSCSNASNDTVIISTGPTPAYAGPDQELCLATSVTLAATKATTGKGLWTYISGPSGYKITDSSLYNTTITNLVTGKYVFCWTTSFSNCSQSKDSVLITIDSIPTKANAGMDDTICSSTINLSANKALTGNGLWSLISGSPDCVITNPALESTTVTGLTAGAYLFQWKISNGACSASLDTMQVNVTATATVANAGQDQFLCAVNNISLAGNKAITGKGIWTLIPDTNSIIIADSSLETSMVTGLIPGAYTFRWTITNGNCPPTSDSVVITIYDSATISHAGPLQNICGSSATITANKAMVGKGKWTVVQAPASQLPPTISDSTSETTTIGSLVAGTYIFKWTITNGSCSNASNDTVIISNGPTPAYAGPDQELCSAASVTLAAAKATIGNGLWTYINGPSGYKITDSSLYNTTVTNLVPGKYVFCWTTSFSNCSQSKDSVLITIDSIPTKANAGIDDTICSSIVNLSANKPLTGTGLWSLIGGPGSPIITDSSLTTTSVKGLTAGAYSFQWKISNGVCNASYDTVQVIVAATTTVPDAGPDQTLCADTSTAILAANDAIVGKGSWLYINGPKGYTITDSISALTTVTGLVTGNYNFSWAITNSVCPTSSDTMQIIVLDSLHNLITNLTDTICSGQQAIINGNVPTGGNGAYTYQWQQSDDGVTNWTDIPSATNQNYAGTLSASAYFRREVTSLPCQSYGNIIFITVQPSVSNNNINNNQTICINTIPSTITGSMPTGGDGNYSFQWQQSIDSGITWNDIPEEKNKNFAPGILMKTTYYRRNVKTSLCSGPQANISNIDTVSIVPDSKALFSAGNIINCAPFILDTVINVTPFPSGNGQYQWYANGIFLGSNSTGIFPGYTILKADDTVNIKLVTISQYGCKADSIQQQFVTVTTSFANFTKDKSYGCGPLAVQFTNTSNVINGVQFFWDFGNGATSNLSQPGSIIFNTNPFNNDTTYKITLKAYNGCDTTVWLDSVKIRANPRARFGIDTTSGCSPFTVHISNTSFGGPNTYYWNFGNGHLDTTYTTGLINYTYNIGNIVDTFPIRLIAENECKSDTDIIDVRIAPNIIHPQIAINGSDLYSCAPHIIAFNNSTTGATQFTWNFGDGSTDLITNNNQSPVIHTFSNPGVYNIAIQLTNGCSDTTVYTQATVYTKPTASFSTSTSYCIDDTVKVNNNSLNATNYNWFWGDGTNSTDINPTHVYTKAGSYIIYLRAEKTNNAGLVCYDTIIKTVNILAKPPVTIQSNINTINCAPFNLNVTASGITDEKATWYFYDSALTPSLITSTGITGQHVYLKPGIFYVKLVAQNGLGCSDSNTINFTVHGTPVAKISPVNSSICKTDTTIDYSNTSTYNGIDGISYQWLINNSLVSVNANFTYHYTLFPGTLLPFTFNTLLIATNTVGCSDTSQAVLKMNPTAEAMFSITNPNDCVPFNLNITNTSQYTSVYKWLVNDVITSSLPDPVITISNPSTPYTITLIADNVYGCKPDTTLFSFTSRIKPSASFKVSDTLGCTGVLNIATTNTTINASSYTWDWGDATATSTFIAPTHLYSTLGQYLITLTASDGVCNDIANQLVKVSIKPTADFSVNRTIGCDTTTVQFTNLSINASNYLWDFGDGFFDSSVDPIKAYNPSITPYTVKLTAIGNFDCKDSVIKPNLILAKVPPASDFYISPEATISIPDYTFSFTNLTLNSVNYKYLWSLGDSSFAETRDISSHKYSDTGSYPVQLIVLDTITNCTDTTIKIARIDGIPGYLYVPNAFYPNSIKEEFRTFKPVGKGLDSYDFQIFDSWGKLLFESKDIDINGSPVKGWDGTFNGTELPQDAYSWKIVAHFKNGNQWDGMSYGTGANQSRKVTFGTLTLFR